MAGRVPKKAWAAVSKRRDDAHLAKLEYARELLVSAASFAQNANDKVKQDSPSWRDGLEEACDDAERAVKMLRELL